MSSDLSAKEDSTGTLIAVGVIGIGIIGFFMYKDKIMPYLEQFRGIGAAPPDVPAEEMPIVPEGEGPPPPHLEKEELSEGEEYYPLIDVIRYYAQRVSEELDKYQGDRLTMTRKLNIEGYVMNHHKSELEKIARLQNYQILPLKGRAKQEFSKLVLIVAPRVGIDRLPKNVKNRLRRNIGHGDLPYTVPESDFIANVVRMRPS